MSTIFLLLVGICRMYLNQVEHPDNGPVSWVYLLWMTVLLHSVSPKCRCVALWLEEDEMDIVLVDEKTDALEQSGYDYTTLVNPLLDDAYGRRR